MLYSLKNKGLPLLECEKKALSDAVGEKCNVKKCKYLWGFLNICFISNSGREVKFYEFYMILSEVVKMYMPCYRNPVPTLKKS